ncbi:MAG TPA: DEAD/DEAH box helicase [Thermoflexales bacterium]|nr:DEAD/DEAH box helicase [Thermoflexales bacterium]HQW34894.1 DEAD/DEAH box helicase [Thermoflexales bacterium]HQZ23047.1 DEAD/DEAH box helicase [Thermoflexales bacterium]HRA00372.1 DEAD/DEAH box helicase [Thermoflexales bacterium]
MHGYKPENPLIVQSDKTVLLEVDNDQYADARDALARFAELEKSPEYVHTYRISPLSLWNAAAAGLSAQRILGDLERYSKYPLPDNIRVDIADSISRYGRLKIVLQNSAMLVVSDDHALMEELSRHKLFSPLIVARPNPLTFQIDPAQRGHVKRILVQIGFPAEDLAGYVDGEELPFHLSGLSNFTGGPWDLRNYQSEAADIFWSNGDSAGGAGVIVLPCGAGKTIVGMAAMARVQAATLILSPNTVAVRQWIREILDKTSLTEEQVGEYTGLRKDIRPVTVTTYQVLTYRPRKGKTAGAGDGASADEDRPDGLSPKSKFRPIKLAEYPHMQLFTSLNWGLVIYDEVHLLPAPVFRMTAEIQARRRLGLTATLVREDGAEGDVFSLVGPKKYDVPWKELEKQGWIATAECHEVRVSLEEEDRMEYAVIGEDEKYRYAATNRKKLDALAIIADKHKEDSTLIIGQYLTQLDQVAKRLDAPLITGETPVKQREELYNKFRNGEITRLVLSKVGNFSVDLPDANVMIQVSGMFGSRQEEAQRLGRVLRPKRNGLLAHFYTITTRDTLDQEFAAKRQLFLTEQGYHYDIFFEDEIAAYQPPILAANAAPVRRNSVGLLT